MTESNPSAALAAPREEELRDAITTLVLGDLRGPLAGDPQEELTSGPSYRYIVGALAPQRERLEAEKDEELSASDGDDDEQDPAEPAGAARPVLMPSSIGMTFAVDLECPALVVDARWGRYERVHSETQETEKGNPKMVWKRVPFEITSPSIPLIDGELKAWLPDSDRPEIEVRGRVRKLDRCWVVTLFLINGQQRRDTDRDAAWLFQCELGVRAADGSPRIVRKALPGADPTRRDSLELMEEQELAMLYRDELEFAVGHGVGVDWEMAPGERTRALSVRTESAPRYDVRKMKPVSAAEEPALAAAEFGMRELSQLGGPALARALEPLASAYKSWIERQEARVRNRAEGLAEHLSGAETALKRCRKALGRIREGIALLGHDGDETQAFRVANEAMALQRERTRIAQARRAKPDIRDEEVAHAPDVWRPFQLAFFLLNLAATSGLHHPDRSGADPAGDLLWFPTGGGKTEAYLGLAAYVMILRRLQGEIEGRSGEHGVAVLMRYTLRLLTVQQYQRAAALVCALEVIRRERVATDPRFGHEPFRIGLWVGLKTTPNSTEESADAVERARKQSSEYTGSHALQLTRCPWCGSELTLRKDVFVDPYPGGLARSFTRCGDPRGACPFTAARSSGEGLPLVTVDEEIYRRLPALLIATVDKFARMPWAGETQMLFGHVDARCPRHGFVTSEITDAGSHHAARGQAAVSSQPHGPLRPPDLIIQDELHLISGPLGSLVGLYETALDALCSWEVGGRRVRPKLVASTATIRRADQQMRDLFARRLEVFPPQGLDARDNFFAQRDEEDPGRRYLAICAPGRRVKATYIRAYVAAMLAAQTQYERWDMHADPWMTLVGYFNTLRDLGAMRRVVDDDVRQRLARGAELGFRDRKQPYVSELTSRMPSSHIPQVLERLEIPFSREGEQARKVAREKSEKTRPAPIDVLLATSMVSVGVDVPRLGLMVVAGQPKTTSEYIQATSRVGRIHPGLVLVALNWSRPRDLSHYERFRYFHETFYRNVEALSVTPFSPRALDRGLSGVLVALIRLWGRELNGNATAQAFEREHPAVQRAKAAILSRVSQAPNDVRAEVERLIERRLDLWGRRVRDSRREGGLLGYEMKSDGRTAGLLRQAELGSWDEFTCLNSLRDVEPTINLVLSDYGMDRRAEADT